MLLVLDWVVYEPIFHSWVLRVCLVFLVGINSVLIAEWKLVVLASDFPRYQEWAVLTSF